jgi:hypothetical protein
MLVLSVEEREDLIKVYAVVSLVGVYAFDIVLICFVQGTFTLALLALMPVLDVQVEMDTFKSVHLNPRRRPHISMGNIVPWSLVRQFL